MISFRFGRPGIRLFEPKRIFLILGTFLLLFPKGGFKIGAAPITWGYLLLGGMGLFCLMRPAFACSSLRFTALLFLFPFQLIAAGTMAINGISNVVFTLSFFIAFFLLPWTFFFLFSRAIEALDLKLFYRFLRKGILFLAIYGIFLFIYKQISGKFIEIPFLTVNFHDFGDIENKCINRGSIFKLISTYNNGNLFGICLLMLLPLYLYLEPRGWKKALVKLSLILTLSRTVWAGLILNELLFHLFVSWDRKSALRMLVALFALAFCVAILSQIYSFRPQFLWDTTLGGRRGQFEVLKELSLFSSHPFDGIPEIVYLGILFQFGALGLFSYILCMASPLFLALRFSFSPERKAIGCGLLNYLFVSGADGALLLIPVIAFYWFMASLLLRRSFLQPATASPQSP